MKILILGGGGYIGSRVYSTLSNHYDVSIEDNGTYGIYKTRDISTLNEKYLQSFDRIIWLAGIASTSICNRDLSLAVKQNVTIFKEVLDKLKGWDGIFYYASTGSVYGNKSSLCYESDILEDSVGVYDKTKQKAESIAKESQIRTVGLRFGTVCGWSLNYRIDVIINAFVETAFKSKELSIINYNVHRGILALSDICDFFVKNIHKEIHTPILNLASFNDSIGKIGEVVANKLKIGYAINTRPYDYDFMLNIDKVKNLYDWKPSHNLMSIIDELLNNRKHIKYGARI